MGEYPLILSPIAMAICYAAQLSIRPSESSISCAAVSASFNWSSSALRMFERHRYRVDSGLPSLSLLVMSEQEVCKLQWNWEIAVPELGTRVFLIPAGFGGRSVRAGVKNRDERLVVMNDVAKSVIEKQRGKHPLYVFPFGKPDGEGNETTVHRMNDSAWKKARIRAAKKWQEKFLRPAHDGFTRIRIHDLKHTFGRRLRAAGVTEEDRKALLGHKNGSITSHYSAAELDQLIAAANKVSATDSRAPALTILKRREA